MSRSNSPLFISGSPVSPKSAPIEINSPLTAKERKQSPEYFLQLAMMATNAQDKAGYYIEAAKRFVLTPPKRKEAIKYYLRAADLLKQEYVFLKAVDCLYQAALVATKLSCMTAVDIHLACAKLADYNKTDEDPVFHEYAVRSYKAAYEIYLSTSNLGMAAQCDKALKRIKLEAEREAKFAQEEKKECDDESPAAKSSALIKSASIKELAKMFMLPPPAPLPSINDVPKTIKRSSSTPSFNAE